MITAHGLRAKNPFLLTSSPPPAPLITAHPSHHPTPTTPPAVLFMAKSIRNIILTILCRTIQNDIPNNEVFTVRYHSYDLPGFSIGSTKRMYGWIAWQTEVEIVNELLVVCFGLPDFKIHFRRRVGLEDRKTY